MLFGHIGLLYANSFYKQWKYVHINNKIVYPIAKKRLVGATRICDWDSKAVRDINATGTWANGYDFTPWTITTDDYFLAVNAKNGYLVGSDSDADWFCFICY